MSVKLYRDDMPARAYQLCLLGLTNEQLGIAFGVTLDAIHRWMRKYPEFKEAVNRGKLDADALVAEACFKRATGYTIKEQKVFCNAQGLITRVDVDKYFPPETNAITFWLKNRQKELWGDVWKLEHSGPNGKPIEHKEIKSEDISKLTDEELELLYNLKLKFKKDDEAKNG